VIDEHGYVTITGRLKEIINRGGEKISPREIDEVLLEHAAVQQAVAFAIPHAVLGEEVGVAVVLKEDARVTERELLAFVAGRLAAFKVPSTVRLVEELPRGATGKVQRLHMARLLGLV
jgi:acyl-CoA synthetase (AMP-forming)/AMP-acid ligase II